MLEDDDAIEIVNHLPSLTYLSFSMNPLRNSGCVEIARKLKKLVHLNLAWTYVEDAGINEVLEELLLHNKTLKYLSISSLELGIYASANAVNQLQKKLPLCVIKVSRYPEIF